jgi:hypothetical protein
VADGPSPWAQLERRARTSPAGRFETEPIGALPEPARRYLSAAIEEGTPLANGAWLEMRGRIKLGRWLSFTARQVLAPRFGTVWMATIAGIIRGGDRYVAGVGGMDWRLFGRLPVMRADGDDVSRSTAERAAGESIWVPTAVLADPATTWSAEHADGVTVTARVDDHVVDLHHEIDAGGRLRSSHFDRWGDPDRTRSWATHPFGVEVTGNRTFEGVTIPNRGRAGWHFGTPRWEEGVFYEYEISGYELLI